MIMEVTPYRRSILRYRRGEYIMLAFCILLK